MKTSVDTNPEGRIPRRKFLQISAVGAGALGALGGGAGQGVAAQKTPAAPARGARHFRGPYRGDTLNQVAFPMGGIGAGMICLEGTGALSHVSLRNHPELFHEPCLFAAIAFKGAPTLARVVEGPVPARKIFGARGSGNGEGGTTYGLPRFAEASFEARFPFATVTLSDPAVPLEAQVTGWSPL